MAIRETSAQSRASRLPSHMTMRPVQSWCLSPPSRLSIQRNVRSLSFVDDVENMSQVGKAPTKYWQKSLNLVNTKFPSRPVPGQQAKFQQRCTDRLYRWQQHYRADQKPFILHDGPPYANGELHIGHALNKILKDLILRTKLQQGQRVIYVPGWDCHGLPIEQKAIQLAKSFRKEENRLNGTDHKAPLDDSGIRSHARSLAMSTVENQKETFRSWGILADWDNAWRTMDAKYGKGQLDIFRSMVARRLIYRRYKPVHWSVSSKTALAEAELDKGEAVETAAFVRFPVLCIPTLLDQKVPGIRNLSLVIWTTLPWTLPANRAICVHEDLEYTILRHGEHDLIVASDRVDYVEKMCFSNQVPFTISTSVMGSDLVGGEYINPIHGLDSQPRPIIHADFVTSDSGTGIVHSAPGFGSDDYKACLRHGIEAFAPVDDLGCFTEAALPRDPWALKGTHAPTGGVDAVLRLMADWVVYKHPHRKQKYFDWRTKKPTFERATAQWFANIEHIKENALNRLVEVQFIPESGRARLESFIKERSEWCISRQRPWGIPIPAIFDKDGKALLNQNLVDHVAQTIMDSTADAWWTDADHDPKWIPQESGFKNGPYTRGKDTMDVWFDSGISWQMTDAEQADVYVEGSDQHRGWFQSSLLTHAMATSQTKAPFKMIITHGFTLDALGRKMSKSEGNITLPREIMLGTKLPPVKSRPRIPQALKETGVYSSRSDPRSSMRTAGLGADALRLWVASSDYTKDITMSIAVQIAINKALLKYRGTLRLMLGTMKPCQNLPITLLDQMALVQLQNVMKEVEAAYDKFEFYKGVHAINRWVNKDLSAFYLDALRDRLYCGDRGGVLEEVFYGLLRMLAPVTPLLVEEALYCRPTWQHEERHGADPGLRTPHPSLSPFDAPIIRPHRFQVMPDIVSSMKKVEEEMPWILKAKAGANAALEEARLAKAISSSLRANIVVTVPEAAGALFDKYAAELADIFVVSHAELGAPPAEGSSTWQFRGDFWTSAGAGIITVLPSPHTVRCLRCWKHVETLENELCRRCDSRVAAYDLEKEQSEEEEYGEKAEDEEERKVL